ncbi:hypothetical protein B0O79_3314 [Flavobacteriaceae bacterium MAR_2009_75]|nr:hypothetical protein B0O79_3314 [Flavobacteriaceae bacterium MAR_2009_75]
MRDVVFRNYDRYASKHLLKEIGEHRLRMECENKHLSFPKRLALFYIEAGDSNTMLKYKYTQKGTCGLMVIDRYDLPDSGWVRVYLQ